MSHQYVDVTQVLLYMFWVFFLGLLYYLHREDKREGYPLKRDPASNGGDRVRIQGFPVIPEPKTYLLADGTSVQAPRASDPQRPIAAQPVGRFSGAPLEPTGNPMIDGVGPAAYALRAEQPERLLDGRPMIVPIRVATDHGVSPHDTDPRGFAVIGTDGAVAGKVSDLWVDRSEPHISYLEVALPTGGTVLLPSGFVRYDMRASQVKVASITAAQFATVPRLSSPDQVTKREEDQITAYFSSGHLYATPSRLGPIL